MATLKKCLTSCLLGLIQVYRYFLSALLGPRCRFQPSCSEYAMEAIKKYGCLKGCYLAIKRILRCHPWHAGGIDTVK